MRPSIRNRIEKLRNLIAKQRRLLTQEMVLPRVISGFITASGVLIAAGQLKRLFGIQVSGHTLPEIASGIFGYEAAARLASADAQA